MSRTLTLVRHAKSDWSAPGPDRDRPLAPRGRRQAPATGGWIATHLPPVDLALVSPAERARATWQLVGEGVGARRVETAEAAYTFDGDALLALVREIDDDVTHAVLVGHNPALEELVETLTGRSARMPTSALAVIDLDGPWAAAGTGEGVLRAAGRPATEDVSG